MALGIVKWFNSTKGYGFIAPDQGGEDAFVHITVIRQSGYDTLRPGQKISFDVIDNHGRVAATNLLLWPES